MTLDLRETSGDLPYSDDVTPPRTRTLTTLRPLALRLARTWFDLEIEHRDRVPASGPVVVAGNHVGWLDGPLMAIASNRPVHALTKLEMFQGPLGLVLTAAGQIPLDRDRTDLRAVRTALRVLRDGGVVGVFPEGTRGDGTMQHTRTGAAYLAMTTGAAVLPVSFLGTRLPGGADGSVPPRGSRLVVSYGTPLQLPRTDWPRTQADVAAAEQQVDQAILKTIEAAERSTGMTLPGPLGPKHEKKKR